MAAESGRGVAPRPPIDYWDDEPQVMARLVAKYGRLPPLSFLLNYDGATTTQVPEVNIKSGAVRGGGGRRYRPGACLRGFEVPSGRGHGLLKEDIPPPRKAMALAKGECQLHPHANFSHSPSAGIGEGEGSLIPSTVDCQVCRIARQPLRSLRQDGSPLQIRVSMAEKHSDARQGLPDQQHADLAASPSSKKPLLRKDSTPLRKRGGSEDLFSPPSQKDSPPPSPLTPAPPRRSRLPVRSGLTILLRQAGLQRENQESTS